MERLSNTYEKDGTSYEFPIIIRDKNGRQIYYENSIGDCCESRYDSSGNQIYNETSDGFWWKRKYNSDRVTTLYEDSTGIIIDCDAYVGKLIRAIIIDDDPIVSMYMRARLNVKFGEDLIIETQNEPMIVPGLDIYIVDNQFGRDLLGTTLVTEIRKTAPDALIIAMSSTLDHNILTELMNRGCNGAYDKKHPLDNDMVFTLIANHIDRKKNRMEERPKRSIIDRIKSMFN
jgi:hypothetical protein